MNFSVASFNHAQSKLVLQPLYLEHLKNIPSTHTSLLTPAHLIQKQVQLELISHSRKFLTMTYLFYPYAPTNSLIHDSIRLQA